MTKGFKRFVDTPGDLKWAPRSGSLRGNQLKSGRQFVKDDLVLGSLLSRRT